MTGDLGGLFDGFEAYVTPSDDDWRRAISEGMAVVDTNVLLNLYRFNDATRDDLVEVLSSFGDRLFLPHQVVEEFWRNREGVLRDPRERTETLEALGKHLIHITETFRAWANRVHLEGGQRDAVIAGLTQGVDVAIEQVEALTGDSVPGPDTTTDPVITALRSIADGRVGPAFGEQERATQVKAAEFRRDHGIPPGFKDRKKADGGYGDYFLWEQTIREAASRCLDVLLVTSEKKDDWWRKESGVLRGPHPELARELKDRAGVKLFMVSAPDLLDRAKRLLAADISEDSVENARRVDTVTSYFKTSWNVEGPPESQANVADGWTATTVWGVLRSLVDTGWSAQASAIRAAAENGGFVPREAVYRIAGYSSDRSLRGFTRPVNRMTALFQDLGILGDSVPPLLEASYGEESYGSAIGFVIPADVIPLVLEADR